MKAINLLIAIALPKRAPYLDKPGEFTFRINFLTLTLPCAQGNVTDSQLKSQCLAPWIRIWKKKCPGLSYVWRAERQKNGNLHFHLITDKYVPWQQMRDTWNDCLSKFHFIDKFQEKHHHRNPNSTDVHSVQKIRDLAAYVAKYMSKNTKENQPTPGRCWDCSANLKVKHRTTIVRDTETADLWEVLYNKLIDKSWENEYSQGIRMTEKEMEEMLPRDWFNQYQAFLKSVRDAALHDIKN